ncbi:MAG: SOS response-associated peptidase [Candidatus Bipolaricaulia bacterium]
MCGRFTLTRGDRDIEAEFDVAIPAGYRPRYNIAPTQEVLALLADGFYEWQTAESGKIPVYIRLKSRLPFGFAGLWESWTSPDDQALNTCTIVTTEPNELIQPIHNRMPVIVPKQLPQ